MFQITRRTAQILVVNFVLLYASVFSKIYFQEEFSDGDKWQERWILSEHPSRQWGFFILTAGKFYGHLNISKGIQTFQNGMHYGLSTKFPAFSNKGKTFVLQYTMKNEQEVTCSGGYIKLFNCSLEPEELNEKTPYLIMFGPDKCIPTLFKVHVILNYKGNYLEIKKKIPYKDDSYTHLYTLIIRPDNTYAVKVDNVDVANGRIEGAFLPPKVIRDTKAKKPKDWEDNPTIEDPTDKKPDDWDQPEYIPDPTAERPLDWDETMDGEWEPPLINNPEFKGVWKPRRIPNPKYKGPWTHPNVENPEYFEDPELYVFDEICAVGIDIWQVQSGTIFDNILITDDTDFAEEHGWKTWASLKDAEKKMGQKYFANKKRKERKHIHDEL